MQDDSDVAESDTCSEVGSKEDDGVEKRLELILDPLSCQETSENESYFMVDFRDYPDHDEATAVPNSKDATLTILDAEADTTAYHEKTIAESHDTL